MTTAASKANSAGLTDDALLGGRLQVLQPARGYRIAIDPVLLAAAVSAVAGQRVLDLGCGVGGASLCLLGRLPGLSLAGVEKQQMLAMLARQNAGRNGFADNFRVTCGDIADDRLMGALGLFDHVMANPPYYTDGGRRPSPLAGREAAQAEKGTPLDDWLAIAGRHVRPGGTVTFIHLAARLDEVLRGLAAGGCGAARVLPLLPKAGRAAKRVLVQATRGAGGGPATDPGLILHREDGGYTAAADAVLRHGAALFFADPGAR